MSLFQTINDLFEFANMMGITRMNKPRRLSHVNFFGENTIQNAFLSSNCRIDHPKERAKGRTK